MKVIYKANIRNKMKAIRILTLIPNLPLIIILAIYLFIKIYRNTGIIEMEFIEEGDEILTKDIRDYIKSLYPKVLLYSVAVMFYGWLIINYINNKGFD